MSLSVANTLEIPEPSHWPTPMGRFGLTPDGRNRYRVVFAPTVHKLVFGEFSDGYTGARLRKTYPQTGNKWILEKWISGFDDTKMTPAEYERWGPRDPRSGMLINGPYPFKGTYNECHTFESGNPELGSIEKVIKLVEEGAKRSPSQIKANNRMLDAKEEKEAAERRFLRVRETEPLYGVRPANFAGTPKTVNHKSARNPVSANELRHLPYKRGSVVSLKGPTINASI